MRQQGRLSNWNDAKGYGFITPLAGGKKLFVHISDFPRGVRRPAENETLSYLAGRDSNNKPCAREVQYLRRKLASGKLRWSVLLALCANGLWTAFLLYLANAHRGYLPLLSAYILMSITTYLVYGADKRAARRGARRTPEARLHWLALACGWPGALLAQQVFRHKTRKPGFLFKFYLAVAANIGALWWLLYAPGAEPLRRGLERWLS